ncbi:MAG: tRNA (adenosine(37)-N6)-dimethylallyltransferase MiaA [Bacteroidales bacterium]|nr:tRNA (adenosine(37)-N6)-dimethylallyltransferase MiaA [Bacteroidales bacterium]
MSKLLVVIAGPTAVGKTSVAVGLACALKTHILSCDSRQFFRELAIGTAIPTPEERHLAPHHFIGYLSVKDYYNAARYELEAFELLEQLFIEHDVVLLCGGSGLYINALCKGIDELPDPDPIVRRSLKTDYTRFGIGHLQHLLQQLDPEYYDKVDTKNPNRLLRAIEVSIAAGKPYSTLLRHESKPRLFNILKIGLNRERTELFNRINHRADKMIAQGLVEEVRSLAAYRHLNALNTVGYKEIFEYFDAKITLEQAVADIKTNTRRYAKRQLTWFKKDPEYQWFHPSEQDEVLQRIKTTMKSLI